MARPSGRRTSQFHLPQGQPQPEVPSIQNNFVGGLKTEFTGLNFPENACTATSNCRFTRTGNVLRRNGFDYEKNFSTKFIGRVGVAISTFTWVNAGGNGNTQMYIYQVGNDLFFYQLSNATAASPLSSTFLAFVDASTFVASGGTYDATKECTYSTGNGYLFVFHPSCDPFFVSFIGGILSATRITLQIRDFQGSPNDTTINTRPASINNAQLYNLLNQGWTNTALWSTTSTTSAQVSIGLKSVTVATGLTINNGDYAFWSAASTGLTYTTTVYIMSGSVVGYNSGTGLLNIYVDTVYQGAGNSYGPAASPWTIVSFGSTINQWINQLGIYPSNSDIWWIYKDQQGLFQPSLTFRSASTSVGLAPRGHFILNAFNQDRSGAANDPGINPALPVVKTTTRPRIGAWFQGRVFYAGIDANDTNGSTYTWTENIYFSQIQTNNNTSQFGFCYQVNDPTSQELNTLLPSDGGFIQIQGCGSIFKLFPVQNGLLVFAANGIWFITGNSGLGFTADDYQITKVSGEHSLSSTSFVDVAGWPIFWNANDIYMVAPGQSYTSGQTALQVKNLSLPTIKQFFQTIPLASKQYARGSYNHITGEVQWIYRSTMETDVTSRYSFDSVLVFLTYTEAFYPWAINPGFTGTFVHSADYIEYTGSNPVTAPPPLFKYLTSTPNGGAYNFTFSEERNSTTFTDWASAGQPGSFISTFTTGYMLKGQGQRHAQPEYIWLYTEIPTAGYTLQGIFDYAGSPISGKISGVQTVNVNKPLFNKVIRRHRIRGNGYVCQLLINSLDGTPFNFSGWAILDTIGIM